MRYTVREKASIARTKCSRMRVKAMVVDRLQQALEHVEELTPEEQEDIAEQILTFAGRSEPRGARARRLAGAWADLPDDMEETLLRWRRETPPTPLNDDLPGEQEDTGV